VFLGRVAFQAYTRPGWEQGDRVQVGRYPHETLFAKAGLWVRGPDPIVLRVDAPVLMKGWSAAGKNTEITIPPCADQEWRVFPGGFLIPRPRRCVTLEIEVAERRAQVPFGVGVSC
jgi:hypothetical protein